MLHDGDLLPGDHQLAVLMTEVQPQDLSSVTFRHGLDTMTCFLHAHACHTLSVRLHQGIPIPSPVYMVTWRVTTHDNPDPSATTYT